MKTLVLVLALCLCAVVIPTAAEGHTVICRDGPTAQCVEECTIGHLDTAAPHRCAIVLP